MFKNIVTKSSILFVSKIIITIAFVFFSYATFKKYELEKIKADKIKEDIILSDSLSRVKIYQTKEIPQIGLSNLVLKSKYINGKMKYSLIADFIIDPLGIISQKFPTSSRNYNDYIEIKFVDNDNFNIVSATTLLRNIANITNEKNEKVGISLDGEVEINKATYMKIRDWDIEWVF